jgi:hypothetical protein
MIRYDDETNNDYWVNGYNAALVDVRSAIREALGEKQ